MTVHPKPKLDAVAEQIAAWAATKREIDQVWLFGSRVTGRSFHENGPPKPESDLDLAIELDDDVLREISPNDETPYARSFFSWQGQEERWKAELGQISPWRVQLVSAGDEEDGLAAIKKATGRIIYQKHKG